MKKFLEAIASTDRARLIGEHCPKPLTKLPMLLALYGIIVHCGPPSINPEHGIMHIPVWAGVWTPKTLSLAIVQFAHFRLHRSLLLRGTKLRFPHFHQAFVYASAFALPRQQVLSHPMVVGRAVRDVTVSRLAIDFCCTPELVDERLTALALNSDGPATPPPVSLKKDCTTVPRLAVCP
ncbi:MAG TPA: hypothetical protein EYO33_28935 [Phycisphaerales bacterium]|nr:hypothetical protein [Phycisphaerales bacterium]